MKAARSMYLRFKKGLALVSPAWMRAARRRKLCERRYIRSGESKRLSPSRGLSTAYGHEFTNCSEKMYSESQLRKAERLDECQVQSTLIGSMRIEIERASVHVDLAVG